MGKNSQQEKKKALIYLTFASAALRFDSHIFVDRRARGDGVGGGVGGGKGGREIGATAARARGAARIFDLRALVAIDGM